MRNIEEAGPRRAAQDLDFESLGRDFLRDGYVVVRGFLPRAVVDDAGGFLADEVGRATAFLRDELDLGPDDDIASAIDAAVADGGGHFAKETRDVAIGHFPLAVRLSERLWPVATALRPLAAALLPAERVAVHLPPAARFVLPHNRRAGVPPHQDFRYNMHLPHFLTIWVPFVDIDEQCGGVVMFDGPRGDDLRLPAPDGPWLGGVATDGFAPHRLQTQRGDVIVLDDRVVHGSAPNVSDRVRISADYRFFDGTQRSRKHALDLDTMTIVQPPESA